MSDFLSVKDAAQKLDLEPATVRKMIRQNLLQAVKMGNSYRIPLHEVTGLTVPEVAELLGLKSKETILRRIRRGELRAKRVGIRWLIDKESVDEFVQRNVGKFERKKKEAQSNE